MKNKRKNRCDQSSWKGIKKQRFLVGTGVKSGAGL